MSRIKTANTKRPKSGVPKLESAKSYGAFGRGTSIGFRSGAVTGTESNAYVVPNGES